MQYGGIFSSLVPVLSLPVDKANTVTLKLNIPPYTALLE